eukprot:9530967-Heterocapsa_arctica.AAC.1
MAVVGSAYSALPSVEEDARCFKLSASVRNELVMLATLAPALTTNLRAGHSDRLICTDASKHTLGA